MLIKKLTSMPYAQAHVEITESGNVYFYSYVTLVASIEDGWLTINGLYSRTTRKHISAFVKEYANTDYQCAKQLFEDGYKFNIFTGEVVEIAD